MRARIAAAIIGIIFLTALIVTGVVCMALAIYSALAGPLGAAAAAAIVAALYLIGPVMVALMSLRKPAAPPKKPTEEILNTVIGSILKNSSLYAVLGAGAIGLAEAFLNRRKK